MITAAAEVSASGALLLLLLLLLLFLHLQNHKIIKLKKTNKIMTSNCQPTPATAGDLVP